MRQRDIDRANTREARAELRDTCLRMEALYMQIPCRVCNRTFPHSRYDAEYCSSKCRQKAYRLRKKGYFYKLTSDGYVWINRYTYEKI